MSLTDEAIKLRRAQSGDAGDIIAFIRELADYENLTHEVVASEQALQTALFGESPAAEVIIADYAGEPAGFALFFTTFSTFLGQPGIWLEDLFVRPARRGAGIGRALLAEIAQIACDRGFGRLEWSVLDWNEPAIGFYRRMGAAAMDEWTTYRVTGDELAALARSKAVQPTD